MNISPKELFDAIIEELKNHPAITLVKVSDVFVAKEDNFIYSQEDLGVILSDEIKGFYKSINGFRFTWKYEDRIRGEANVMDIGTLTQGFYDEFWKDELKKRRSKNDRAFYQFCINLNSLEVFEDAFDGTLRTVVELKKNHPEPQSPPIWLWNLAGEKYPLSIDFTRYWQKLAKTRGFIGWPYFFIDLEKCKFEDAFFKKYFAQSAFDALPFMENFLTTMPVLFPKDDYSEFESLYRKIKSSL